MQTQTSNTLHNAIMEAGSKERPPMLAPGNYVQWKSRIKRYIDTKPNHELIHYCLENPPYELGWKDKRVPNSDGNPTTITERVFETYKNVTQDIRDQLNAEAKAVQIILTGIDNDIYSTIDACLNACEMWKAIERLKQGESINVHDLETNQYWEFGKFTSQDGESLELYYSRFYKMMNELIRNQCKVTNHQVNVQFLLQLQPEWQRSQQAATRNRGKAIVNSPQPIYDQEPSMVDDDDETSKDKEIDNLMDLISLSNLGFNATTAKNLDMLLGNVRNLNGQRMQLITGKRCYYAQNVINESVDTNYDIEQIDQNDEDTDLAKEQLKRRDSIEYASEMELECAKVRGCYNDNLALMLAPESDEVICLGKESRSKLSDLIEPFDYTKLNNLYDLFVPQREKSSEQR
nr:hypothetical protein [Tanacetum cinerariifolium]